MRHTAAINNRAFIFSLTSRFIDSSLSQRDSICARLLSFGDAAIAQRQGARLLEVGHALSSLPLPESFRAIGDYYTGVATGQSEAIGRAASYAPPRYRARAILSLAALARNAGEQHWPQLYAEAINQARRAQDLYTAIHASKMLAIRRGIEGDHWRAVEQIESLWPMVRLIAREDPAIYFDVLNSLAVELAEAGRLDEAAAAIRIVQASPLLEVNPEWRHTAAEIEQAQAQPLIIAVPELKRSVATAVAVIDHQLGHLRIDSMSADLPRADYLLTCIPNRAAIRAGPRAPPLSIL